MRVYGLRSCDTCRKAMKSLTVAGYEPELQDVREEGFNTTDLERFYAEFGTALLNTRSTTWRSLTDDQRKMDPLWLISEHPALMKRPVVESSGRMTLGWDANTQAKWLEGSVGSPK